MSSNSQSEVSMGSFYEINQKAYDSVLPYNKKDLTEHLDDVFEWLYERRCNYAMLLCHERRDYTIFNYLVKQKGSYEDGTLADLRECLTNRGKVLDIAYQQDQDAWEIWIRVVEEDGPINYMFMFFDCEPFVIEV